MNSYPYKGGSNNKSHIVVTGNVEVRVNSHCWREGDLKTLMDVPAVYTALFESVLSFGRRYFWHVRRLWQRQNGKFVDFSDPFRFHDAPARNAFEYIQMIYLARNESHWPLIVCHWYGYYFSCNYLSLQESPANAKGSTRQPWHMCKGVDCSTISHTVYTMYCRHQYGWYSVNWSFIIVLCCI